MRVILTGGTGLIGRALAAELVAAGYEVIVLSRTPHRARGLPSGIRIEAWDGRTTQGWGGLADGAYGIVNLAGENIAGGRWTEEYKRRIRQSRLDAGRAVVEAVRAAKCKPAVVVQASGVGYYGPRGDEEVTEEFLPGSDFLGRLAVEWEASTAPVEEMGVRQVVIRTGVVLSQEGGALPRLVLPFRFFLGGPLGRGRQWVPWIHITDEVRAIRFLLEKEDAQGPYNLVAPHPVTNRELARGLGQVLRRPAWIPVPAPALRLVLGEMSAVLLTGQRAIPKRLLEAGFQFRFPDLGSALRNLFPEVA
ncbi:MAG: TIGR01777 family oxidoreductase [Anaerolineae bacterium]|nr:TIGR01777 family oxidoreductase [Anaerolineae bacterium]